MSEEIVLYGIATCATVRKARHWLDAHGIACRYHDLRKDGFTRADLVAWAEACGWERLVNRAGTTWRRLSGQERDLSGAEDAIALILAHPAVMKRPLLRIGDRFHLGFRPEQYAALFGADGGKSRPE
ncbi:Spx/MgsR family RNA polymerase-binding regulatory protein [Swaminathania salitolerans]|uniref:Arsenate reductase n=1 Tax=Swaminathania salitolerans TaxID=182838 RepID=A0A511BMN1_9PROT|nr:Spx/MgsR family RNA polymerase-binding regulatory protein [Swaminathania salitolerans]GBQ16066.1 hypothetical protein AA21291_2398 [Swaminathania salitolerans LMG 21291]GEL01587.1 arsenate reductase [Swaminathania salitolerans]